MAVVTGAIAAAAGAGLAGVSLVNAIVHDSVRGCLRSVVINLSNKSSATLTNPQVYTYSGLCYLPPEPQLEKEMKESFSFGQRKGTACGAVGVLTYDITENQKKNAVKRLAIMFSVPFNYIHYKNLFALGLFETTQACDHSLYERMYYKEGSFKRERGTGSEISFQGGKYTLKGTMSPVGTAEMQVHFLEEDSSE